MSGNISEFQKLVKPDGYQVFLFTSPASVPFEFAVHPWFVCVKDGKITRWEVRFEKNLNQPEIGKHLHLDSLPPFSGIEIVPGVGRFFWATKFIGEMSGGTNSTANQMYNFILASPQNYKYCDTYSFFGPNSNTYAYWVLNEFPDFPAQLPWNSVGKKYPR